MHLDLSQAKQSVWNALKWGDGPASCWLVLILLLCSCSCLLFSLSREERGYCIFLCSFFDHKCFLFPTFIFSHTQSIHQSINQSNHSPSLITAILSSKPSSSLDLLQLHSRYCKIQSFPNITRWRRFNLFSQSSDSSPLPRLGVLDGMIPSCGLRLPPTSIQPSGLFYTSTRHTTTDEFDL
jgi:hypothetical protein